MNRIEAREKAFLSLFEWSFSEEAELNIIEETNDYSKYTVSYTHLDVYKRQGRYKYIFS